jgi:hypothetical protein
VEKTPLKQLLVFGALLVALIAPRAHAYGARYYFQPSAGSYTNGATFTVTLYMDTQGDAVNAGEGTFSFPTRYLQVESLSTAGSVFKFWSQDPSFSNSSGNLSFGGGLPSPGVSSPSAKVISITFRAMGVGAAKVHLENGAILANDGIGTNILTTSSDGAYSIQGSDVVPPSPDETPSPRTVPVATDVPGKPKVTSTTHPDEDIWYNKDSLVLAWDLSADVTGVSYGLFDSSKHTLAESSKGLVSGTSYDLTKYDNGTWYFMIELQNAKGWGPALKRRVNIDRAAPKSFIIARKVSDDATDPQPVFTWSGDDADSGIDRYDYKVGDAAFASAVSLALADGSYRLPVTAPGAHTLTVRAYDRAGNFTDSATSFVIAPLPLPIITDSTKSLASPNQVFTIRGSAIPNGIITILFTSGTRSFTASAQADANGYWALSEREHISAGTWEVRARVTDARGAMSNPTAPVTLRVKSLFGNVWPFILEWSGVIMSTLAALALIVAFALYLAHHIRLWRWALKRDLRAFKVELQKDLAELEADLGPVSSKTGSANRNRVRRKVAKIEEDVSKEIDRLDSLGR